MELKEQSLKLQSLQQMNNELTKVNNFNIKLTSMAVESELEGG
jgi:hypothetical protein